MISADPGPDGSRMLTEGAKARCRLWLRVTESPYRLWCQLRRDLKWDFETGYLPQNLLPRKTADKDTTS